MVISFVILYYKQKEYLNKLLKSIRYSKMRKEDYELLIIDNNSNDNIKEYLNSIKNMNIYYFNNPYQKNQSHSRNIGINNANGKYILYIDSDDYYNSIILNKFYILLKNINTNIVFNSSLVENRNNNMYIIKNTLKVKEPTLSTYQYAVLKKYTKNILWDEKKYFWDNEDLWYGLSILSNTQDYTIFNFPINTHLKIAGSNSDRIISNEYKKYFYELLFEFINKKSNLIQTLIYNFIKQLK